MLQADQARVKECLDYDPETGAFTNRVARGNLSVGKQAGTTTVRGYIQLQLHGRTYFAHRLAWLYVFGKWPPAELDHINGDTSDNRIANLREATRSQNKANGRVQRNNKAGMKGIYNLKGRWAAQIRNNGRRFHLGYFSTAEEAHAAYVKAARELHGQFARTA